MASVAYKFNVAVSSLINLTSVSNNPSVAPVTTPRQGGFTLRNRINVANITSANATLWTAAAKSSASQATSAMLVLEVPKRTFVKHVSLRNPAGSTAPTTAFANVHASANSFASGAYLQLGGVFYKNASQSLSSSAIIYTADSRQSIASMDGTLFGALAITKETGATAGLPSKVSTSSSTPYTGGEMFTVPGADEQVLPKGAYFPYGGFVTLQLGPHGHATASTSSGHLTNVSSSSATTFKIAGVWEFMADCEYLPE